HIPYIAENRIVHTFELIVSDFHRMVVMCMCDGDCMAVMGMWFHRMVVMSTSYKFGNACYTVDVGFRMMVVHFLEFLDHVVYLCLPRLRDKWFFALIMSLSRLFASATYVYRQLWVCQLEVPRCDGIGVCQFGVAIL
ncbi:hypothetical protein Tco_0135501, partial [Tanacetum coccineum]